MMKPGKIIGIQLQCLKNRVPSSSIGLEGFNFSRRIVSKYGIFYRSDSLPTLIFRKFFGTKNNNSSHCRPCNNYLSLLEFNYFINIPLQKNFSFFSNFVISNQDIRTCTRTLTSMRFYNPALAYQYIHQHFYLESAEKTKAKSCLKNRFIQNTGPKKIEYEQIRENDKQFIHAFHQPPSYIRKALTLVYPAELSYLQNTFNFDPSTNIHTVIEGVDTPCIVSAKPKILVHQCYRKIETAISDSNRMISSAKNVKRPLAKSRAPQGIIISSFWQTRILKDNENIVSEQIGKEKRRFIPKLIQVSIHSKTVLILSNPAMFSYLHRNNIKDLISKTVLEIPVARTMSLSSKLENQSFKIIKRLLFWQNRTLEDDGNIAPEHIEEWENHTIPVFLHQPSLLLHQPSLFTRNILTPEKHETRSYLRKTFNSEFAGFKPARILVKRIKKGKDLTNIHAVTKILETLSFKRKETNTLYENNIKHIREVKKQLIHVLYLLHSSKIELTQLRCRIKHRQAFYMNYNSSSLKSSASVFLVQLHKSYKRNALKSVNPEEPSCLGRISNFDISTSINGVTKGMYTPWIVSAKPEILVHQCYRRIETAISDSNRMISTVKKGEGLSAIYKVTQCVSIPSLRQTKILKDYENIASELIEEMKEKLIQKLHHEFIFSKTVLTLVNQVISNYLHKNDIDVFVSKIDPEIPVVRTLEKPSKQKHEVAQTIKKPLHPQTGALKDNVSIPPQRIEEWEKQLMPVILHQPSLKTRNTLTLTIPLTLSYLRETFNFEFASLKLGRKIVSATKFNKKSKIINAFTRDAEALSFQQIRNIQDLQNETIFNHDIRPGREHLFPSIKKIKTLKKSINNSFHNSSFSIPLMNLRRFDHIVKKSGSPEVDTDIVYNSGELVLKKPTPPQTEIFSENEKNIQTPNLSPTETREDSGKHLVKEKKMHEHEIGMIADRVYKIIEKRISIEKDRRGLF